MSKDYRQMLKRLQATGLILGIEDRGGPHVILLVRGGARYTSARSPSDWRVTRNVECAVKKLAR